MSEVKFTKGQWEIKPEECGKDYIRIRGTIIGGRFKIANVITPIYAGVHDRELDETRANANLIAAAPEMYEILDALCTYLIDLDSLGTTHKARQIEKLLAKARGE